MDPSVLETIRLKVCAFRVPDARDVLGQLGMAKHGRKDELHARILTIFQDAATLAEQGHVLQDQGRVDNAARIVNSTFQKLLGQQHGPAQTAAAKLWQRANANGNAVEAAQYRIRTYSTPAAPAAAAGVPGDAEDAAAHPGHKRPRITTLMPQRPQFRTAAAGAAAPCETEEVITAFLAGEEGIGATNTKVRCVCAQHTAKEPMLQCEGAFCGVWQHASCVKQQLLHSQLNPLLPGCDQWPRRRQFFCERCRIARADPFWEVYDALVMPPQLGKMTPGRLLVSLQTGQQVEVALSRAGPAKITLSSHQLRLLQGSPQEYQLQAVALCLDDPVQFRSQWPTAPVLKLGSRSLRVNARLQSVPLGAQQRDSPANLTPLLAEHPVQDHGGMALDLSLEFADPQRAFVLLAYIMRRRTREQVKALMKPPETLQAAVRRMQQFMNPRGVSSSTNPAAANGAAHGHPPATSAAAAAGHDDEVIVSDDDDDDIVLGNRVVTLKDPNTFGRIVQPARFTDTCGNDPQPFDLETFLEMAQSTLKWVDPHNMKASCVQNLQVDTYLAHVLAGLANQPEVLEVEINEQAEWRPRGSSGPFRSVLAGDAPAAAAAAAGGSNDGGAGAAAGLSSEDEDEAAELRRAASEVRRGRQHEVIELLSSDDEEDGGAAAGGGGGLRIHLPSRAQQQQQHLQQQAATASVAAAAVGPSVLHMAGSGGPHQGLAPVGSGGVASPRIVTTNAPGTQHQHQQQNPPGQQQQQWQQQQHHPQQQVSAGLPPGYVLQQVGSGEGLQQQQQQQQQQPHVSLAGSVTPQQAMQLNQQAYPQVALRFMTNAQQQLVAVPVAVSGPGQQFLAPALLLQQPNGLQQQLPMQQGGLPQLGSVPLPSLQPQQQQQQLLPGQLGYMQQQQQQLHGPLGQ